MRRVSAAPPPRRRRTRWTRWRSHLAAWLLIPAVLAVATVGAAGLGHLPLGHAILHRASSRLLEASAALGLEVSDIRVTGRATTDRQTILDALGARLGTPILGVDLVRAKRRLESLPWVHAAVIERRLPDTLDVHLVERVPLALWQHDRKIQLIDRTGAVIPVTRLDRFAKLPMVVGPDAASHAAALLKMLRSEPDLAARVTAAVWVGDRRWNLRLDNSIDVLLPADDPEAAWADLARLERSSAILQRDVETIDMRLPDRLVLRLVPQPAKDPAPEKKGRPTAKNT
jgi:cell division protein FtsQ